jgi:hypothetical protein
MKITHKIVSIFLITLLYYSCTDKIKPEIKNIYSISSLDSLSVDQLQKHRIVMLSDSYHGHSYYMRNLINLLSEWLDQLVNNLSSNKLPSKIVLFLENITETQNQINQFIETGDIITLLDYRLLWHCKANLNNFSADYMVFLDELININLRINKLNRKNTNNEICLKILGAESYPPFDFDDILDMSREEHIKQRTLWFVHERDKHSASNINNFLKENPEYKALIFYGGAHLLRERVNKNRNNKIFNKELYGYFLAHYLDSLFTRNQVSVFKAFASFNRKKNSIEQYKRDRLGPDFCVYHEPIPAHPLSMSFIKTKTYFNTLYSLLLRISQENTKVSNVLSRKIIFLLHNLLMRTHIYHEKNVINKMDSLLTHVIQNENLDSTINDFLNVCNNILKEYDVIEELENFHNTITFNHYADSVRYNQELKRLLSNIPEKELNVDLLFSANQNSDITLSPTEHQKLINYKSVIKKYLAVNFLFVADEQEEIQIIDYLKNMTGLNLNSKSEWYNWLLLNLVNNS